MGFKVWNIEMGSSYQLFWPLDTHDLVRMTSRYARFTRAQLYINFTLTTTLDKLSRR